MAKRRWYPSKKAVLDRFGRNSALDFEFRYGFCNHCAHVFDDGITCLAYPDGIPQEILFGDVDHREPYEGDGGITFEPRDESFRADLLTEEGA